MTTEKTEHIEWQSETLITIEEARKKYIPRRPSGKVIHAATVWRWIHRGLSGRGKERIYLEVIFVGQQPMTSVEALGRFFRKVTDARVEREPSQKLDHATEDELTSVGL